jgi:hypothetical protein
LSSNPTKVAETTILSCTALSDSGWVATGTVHNSTGSPRSYLVSVAFDKASGPVGYAQARVRAGAGQSAPWVVPKRLGAGAADLTCRVLAVS